MTDEHEVLDVPGFYDRLAGDYDAMTEFEKRYVREKPFFRLLVERYRIAAALDAGSGTGFHSLMLARLGVSVTAVDASPVMLERLGAHARAMNLHVTCVETTFQKLSGAVAGPFDAVFCLGNSLPHLLTEDDLRCTLENFRDVLRPGGLLYLQLLNYHRILAERKRVQNVRQVGDVTFERSYEYDREDGLITFSFRRSAGSGSDAAQETMAIPLRPLQHDYLETVLRDTGYEQVHPYGGIALEAFNPSTSTDLVIMALRRS
ncbi:MAG: class I SAM-dependent methyltransferase [Bacteroidota bacterium]